MTLLPFIRHYKVCVLYAVNRVDCVTAWTHSTENDQFSLIEQEETCVNVLIRAICGVTIILGNHKKWKCIFVFSTKRCVLR